MVMSFSTPVVDFLLKKSYKRGVMDSPGPPLIMKIDLKSLRASMLNIGKLAWPCMNYFQH